MSKHNFYPVTCHFIENNLVAYHAQALPFETADEVRQHTETCDHCSESLADYTLLIDMMQTEGIPFSTKMTHAQHARIEENVYRRIRKRTWFQQTRPLQLVNLALFLVLGITGYFYANLLGEIQPVSAEIAQLAETTLALDESPEQIKQEDLDSLLLMAAANSDIDGVQALLNTTANIETKDKTGQTALIYAIRRKNQPIVELLIAHGANVNATTPSKGNALYNAYHAARLDKDTAVFELLLDHGANLYAPALGKSTMWAVMLANGRTEFVQLMLNRGIDVNAFAFNERTPLMLASAAGQIDVVSMLLNADADVQMTTAQGETAKDFAFEAGHTSIVSALVNTGDDDLNIAYMDTIDCKDEETTIEIQLAVLYGHSDVISISQPRGKR